MARAAFYVDELSVTEKGKYLIIEGRRRCPHGHAVEEVFVTVPIKLKHLFAEVRDDSESSEVNRPDDQSPAVAERLRKYFENN